MVAELFLFGHHTDLFARQHELMRCCDQLRHPTVGCCSKNFQVLPVLAQDAQFIGVFPLATRHGRERGKSDLNGDEAIATLENATARSELTERLRDIFDLELLEAAKDRVRSRIETKRWRTWESTATQQMPGNKVAEQLDMKIATVYSSRYRFQQMISRELSRLDVAEKTSPKTINSDRSLIALEPASIPQAIESRANPTGIRMCPTLTTASFRSVVRIV